MNLKSSRLMYMWRSLRKPSDSAPLLLTGWVRPSPVHGASFRVVLELEEGVPRGYPAMGSHFFLKKEPPGDSIDQQRCHYHYYGAAGRGSASPSSMGTSLCTGEMNSKMERWPGGRRFFFLGACTASPLGCRLSRRRPLPGRDRRDSPARVPSCSLGPLPPSALLTSPPPSP